MAEKSNSIRCKRKLSFTLTPVKVCKEKEIRNFLSELIKNQKKQPEPISFRNFIKYRIRLYRMYYEKSI